MSLIGVTSKESELKMKYLKDKVRLSYNFLSEPGISNSL